MNGKQSHERHPHTEQAAMGGVKPEEYLWPLRYMSSLLTCPNSNICDCECYLSGRRRVKEGEGMDF